MPNVAFRPGVTGFKAQDTTAGISAFNKQLQGAMSSIQGLAQESEDRAKATNTQNMIAQMQAQADVRGLASLDQDPIDVNAISQHFGGAIDMEAVTGANTANRDRLLGAATDAASKAGRFAFDESGGDQSIMLNAFKESMLGAGASEQMTSDTSNQFLVDRQETQKLWDQNYTNTLANLSAENALAETPEAREALWQKIQESTSQNIKKQDWVKHRKALEKSDREDQIRAETFTPQQQADFDSQLVQYDSNAKRKLLPLQQDYDAAVAAVGNFDYPTDDVLASYRKDGGVISSIAKRSNQTDTWFGGDTSELQKFKQKIMGEGFSHKEAEQLMIMAYEANPSIHDPNTSFDLWGLLGFDSSGLGKNLGPAKQRLAEGKSASAKMVKAKNALNVGQLKYDSNIAGFKSRNRRRITGAGLQQPDNLFMEEALAVPTEAVAETAKTDVAARMAAAQEKLAVAGGKADALDFAGTDDAFRQSLDTAQAKDLSTRTVEDFTAQFEEQAKGRKVSKAKKKKQQAQVKALMNKINAESKRARDAASLSNRNFVKAITQLQRRQ